MKLMIDKEVKSRFPGYGLAAWSLSINDKHKLKQRREALQKEFLERSDHSMLEQEIEAWKVVFKEIGAKSGDKSSIHSMYEGYKKRGFLSLVNNFVDFYNGLSLVTAVPMGAYSLENIEEYVSLTCERADLTFTPCGKPEKKDYVRPTEVYYRDATKVICRLWNMKDCDETKVIEETTEIIFIADLRGGALETEVALKRIDAELSAFSDIKEAEIIRW